MVQWKSLLLLFFFLFMATLATYGNCLARGWIRAAAAAAAYTTAMATPDPTHICDPHRSLQQRLHQVLNLLSHNGMPRQETSYFQPVSSSIRVSAFIGLYIFFQGLFVQMQIHVRPPPHHIYMKIVPYFSEDRPSKVLCLVAGTFK